MSRASRPIFVLGAPRTGTTMTREILNRHPDVYLCNEVHFFEYVLEVEGPASGTKSPDLQRAFSRIRDVYPWSFRDDAPDAQDASVLAEAMTRGGGLADLYDTLLELEASHQGAIRGGDSSPQDALYIDTIRAWFPNAKIVAIIRDPRAYLASYKNYYKKKISTYHNRYDPLANMLLWRSYMNRIMNAQAKFSADEFYCVRYEDLVQDPDTQVRALCDAVGLEFTDNMLAIERQNSSYFHVNEDFAAKGINASSVDRWREALNAGELWIVERLAHSQMAEFGYALDGPRLTPAVMKDLVPILLNMPVRLFNLLFRTGKPFTWSKFKKAVSSIRS